MKLHDLPKQKGTKTRMKRVGRGYGSGKGGHTVGRGTKGQKSRAGGNIRPGFAGGQTPLYKALPQYHGFNPKENKPIVVNLGQLDTKFSNGDTITLKTLRAAGLLKSSEKTVKILGFGEITKKLTFSGVPLSKSAQEKIIKAGGKVDA
jgi:large subunit ribosomal protein L15